MPSGSIEPAEENSTSSGVVPESGVAVSDAVGLAWGGNPRGRATALLPISKNVTDARWDAMGSSTRWVLRLSRCFAVRSDRLSVAEEFMVLVVATEATAQV